MTIHFGASLMSDMIRDQLIAARRNQILDAAATVFAEKGFHPSTIKDIAREAGIGDGTIYNYYQNKSALLLGVFERMRDRMALPVDISALLDADARTFVRAHLRAPFRALEEDNFELFRVVMAEMLVNAEMRDLHRDQIIQAVRDQAERNLKAWVERHGNPALNTKLVVNAVSATIFGLILRRVMNKDSDDDPEALLDFMANAIIATFEQGRAEADTSQALLD